MSSRKLLDVYNALYGGGELRCRIAAAVFLKSKDMIDGGTLTGKTAEFAQASFSDPNKYSIIFMPEVIGHPTIRQAIASNQIDKLDDSVLEGIVEATWSKLAAIGVMS